MDIFQKGGISQDKVFHETCKQGLLSVYPSSSSGFSVLSCLPNIFKQGVKTKEKSISLCLCKSNKAKVNSRISPQSHSVIRGGQSLISGWDSLEKSFSLYPLLAHLKHCGRFQFVFQKPHTPIRVFSNTLPTHEPPLRCIKDGSKQEKPVKELSVCGAGVEGHTRQLTPHGTAALAPSLLDLQIKPAKTDRSVGINIRKCLHCTIHLSKASFIFAPCLLFMPERHQRNAHFWCINTSQT